MIQSLLCALIVAFAAVATPVEAESTPAPVTIQTTVSNQFPDGLSLSVTLPITMEDGDQLHITAQAGADPTPLLEVVSPEDIRTQGEEIMVSTLLPLADVSIPPGITIRFHWSLVRDGVTVWQSADETGDWFDATQNWQTISGTWYEFHTYGMDDEFVQQMTSTTDQTFSRLVEVYDLTFTNPVSIWVYPDASAFAETRPANSRESVVGYSDAGYGVIVAVVPNGNDEEFGRVIPHEISHQVIAQATDNPYGMVPLWFDEGMATQTQIGGTDGFAAQVREAARSDSLLQLSSLVVSFPFDPAEAQLAYAESWSAIEYIRAQWGEDGIAKLIAAFADGQPVDQAFRTALGVSFDEFETGWRSWVLR